MTSLKTEPSTGCLVCGAPLIYRTKAEEQTCFFCGRIFFSEAVCENGHFICDRCHARGSEAVYLPLLLESRERDPLLLLEQVMSLPSVHMHGPEHHGIVPGVLLCAYRNNGGQIDLREKLREALQRGARVPGGFCGFWGVCGAAVGAGIYASILSGASPLKREEWALSQRLAARCLERIADVGGPRCCKRTSRLAITEAADFSAEMFGIRMEISSPDCIYYGQNRECIRCDCPYFPIREKGRANG